MARTPSNELVEGYIEEVRTYIPSLVRGLESLRETSGKKEDLEEIHRLVHTIKGASSMIGIQGLSNIAFQMEEALDDILAGDLEVTDDAIRAMEDTVRNFQTYCSDYLEKGVSARSMLKKTVLSFRRVRKISEKEDDAVSTLIDSIPEYEGGAPETETGELTEEEISAVPAIEDEEAAMMAILEAEGEEAEWGIGPDDSEVADVPEILPEFLASFHEEADEHIEDLDKSIGTLTGEITEPVPISLSVREEIRKIRRSVHTIKGAAAVIGLPTIPEFGKYFEDYIDILYEDSELISPEIVKLLSDSAGVLKAMVSDPSEPKTEETDLLRRKYSDMAAPATDADGEAARETAPPAMDELETMDVLPELVESFNEEAEGHLEDLGRSLSILESEIPGPMPISASHKEGIRQIRRCVHTIKGAAAVINLANVSKFAHKLEDLLDWLYETADEISPETVAVLIDSADLLERIIAEPSDAKISRAGDLEAQYAELMAGATPEPAAPEAKPGPTAFPAKKAELPEEELAEESEEKAPAIPYQTKTLRVGMERVDELVNLTGEMIIALSAFDQKMDNFLGAVNELEISRNRLRDIARNMEVGYEVKALAGLGTFSGIPASAYSGAFGEDDYAEGGFEDFDSLELDRYSELNLIIRTLNESVIDVGAINTLLSNLYSDFDGHLTRQRVLLSELQNKIMRVRMTPMSTIVNRLRRTVRDVARKLGKKIRLVITGAEIELDRLVWEKLTDPLMHLLRNAADHGIEPPALRQALNKTPVATLKLEASREGNQVVIRITDDGAGLNYDAIRKMVKQAGLSDKWETLSEDELTSMIFHPGLSTRGKISEISGRGVGLDVVKENIQDLKGMIRVSSWKGKGTRFTVRIPLTLAATRALLFTAGGQMFAISLNEIKEILRIHPGNFISEPENAVHIGDEVLPLYYMANVLNIRGEGLEAFVPDFMPGAEPVILVVESGGKRGAFIVDTLVGQKEIVIKSLGTHLRYVRGVSGATIMGDGSIVPILNIEELFTVETSTSEVTIPGELPATEKPLEILVVDDSVSIRQVVARLMEDQGWKVMTAKDGIDALEKMRENRPDFIVLDIEMPRMNGYEFLTAVRNQAAYKDIPIAMLTSRTADKHREKAMALGAKGFVVKPYNDEEFVNLVLELTDQ